MKIKKLTPLKALSAMMKGEILQYVKHDTKSRFDVKIVREHVFVSPTAKNHWNHISLGIPDLLKGDFYKLPPTPKFKKGDRVEFKNNFGSPCVGYVVTIFDEALPYAYGISPRFSLFSQDYKVVEENKLTLLVTKEETK